MEFISKHKKAVILFMTFFCVAAMIVTIYVKDRPMFIESVLGYIVTPAQKAVTAVSGWFSGKINFLADMNRIEQENTLLKAEVERLEEIAGRMDLYEAENSKLRDLMELDEQYPNYEKIGAMVIAKDISNWYMKFLIDKGSNDGLEKDMVVLTTGGLVGRILEVKATQSLVLSLIDDNSSVSAMSARTEDLGFVRGDVQLMKDGLCRMDKINIDAEIMENDEIVTSHLGDIYPPGLTIGHVVEIHPDVNGLTKYAIIQPAVDFMHIDTVLVINQSFRRETEFEEW